MQDVLKSGVPTYRKTRPSNVTTLSRLFPRSSSIVNVPGESTLRRDFIRLQQENKERSEALRRQQLLQEQQLREQEEYKRQLLAERQKRIEQQKEQRRRLEEVGWFYCLCLFQAFPET